MGKTFHAPDKWVALTEWLVDQVLSEWSSVKSEADKCLT